jgi:integrase
LPEVTPARVQRWKVAYLKRKGGNPLKDRVARIWCNSILRQAKSLFSPDRLQFATGLPPDFKSPFEGIRFEAGQPMRYRSTLDLEALIRSAWNDLDEERLKAFLLAAYAGLRRNEIDKLTWDAFDFQKKTITLSVSEHGSLKSEDSSSQVDLEDALVPIFQNFRAKTTSRFVIAGDARSDARRYTRYRAARVLSSLTTWLREKGVSGPKPLHTLRKEFGSRICDQFGIYAASRALRHADIAITSQHYVDKKRRTTLGLGHLLHNSSETVPSSAQAKEAGL